MKHVSLFVKKFKDKNTHFKVFLTKCKAIKLLPKYKLKKSLNIFKLNRSQIYTKMLSHKGTFLHIDTNVRRQLIRKGHFCVFVKFVF